MHVQRLGRAHERFHCRHEHLQPAALLACAYTHRGQEEGPSR